MTDLKEPLFRQIKGWDQVVDPITDDELKDWLVALRSGKYQQGTEQLACGDSYCCLGVLADRRELFKVFKATDSLLVDYDFGMAVSSVEYKLPEVIQDALAVFNDSGATFDEVADVIEAGFTLRYDGNFTDHVKTRLTNSLNDQWVADHNEYYDYN